jgi:hypothetical protein
MDRVSGYHERHALVIKTQKVTSTPSVVVSLFLFLHRMTLPSVSTSTPKIRRHDSGGYEEGNVVISRILLMLACVWPLLVMGWLGTSSSSSGTITTSPIQPPNQHHFPEVTTDWKNPGLSFRKYLDRVDIMGYGPTHPRVAVVLVGDDDNKNNHSDILRSIESVLKYTDRNRLFLICVVLDGVQPNIQEFTNEAKALPQRIWQQQDKDDEMEPKKSHGLRYEERQQQSNKYLAKIHILSSTQKQGIAASRADAIEFISMLSTKHEQAGIKSPEEDLMLLLLQPGSELISNEWLSHVTSALIVPPPLWGNAVEDVTVALQLANAVSFGVVQPQQQGKQTPSSATMSFDTLLRSQWMSANAKDMALSNGYSYPTPALAGSATALRLQTYLHLPAQDTSLSNEWAANLELSLNLWLCADGIDVLSPVMVNRSVSASSSQDLSSQILEPKEMARFAAAWMDISSSQQVFQALSSTEDSRLPKLSRSDWENMMLTAKRHRQFPTGLPAKCRSWKWFVQTFNPLFELPKTDNTVGKEVSKPNDTVVHQQQQITTKKEDPVIQNVVKKETTKPIPKVVQQQPTPPPIPKKEDPMIPQVAQKETIKPISIVAQKQSTPLPTPKKEVDPIIPKVVKQETVKPIPIVAQPQNTPPTQPKKDQVTPQVINQETIKPITAAVQQQQQVNSPPLTAVIKENTAKLLPDETRRKPIRPLDPKRLEIIQKAPAVNITFVSMMKEPTIDFPHKGARDENGKWGYVHDETALRKNPPVFNYPQLKEACDKRDNHYNMLTEQVFVDFPADQEAAKSGKPRAKIFCLVYTIESGHDRIPFIQETWG